MMDKYHILGRGWYEYITHSISCIQHNRRQEMNLRETQLNVIAGRGVEIPDTLGVTRIGVGVVRSAE